MKNSAYNTRSPASYLFCSFGTVDKEVFKLVYCKIAGERTIPDFKTCAGRKEGCNFQPVGIAAGYSLQCKSFFIICIPRLTMLGSNFSFVLTPEFVKPVSHVTPFIRILLISFSLQKSAIATGCKLTKDKNYASASSSESAVGILPTCK
jgi:hypothetical protein